MSENSTPQTETPEASTETPATETPPAPAPEKKPAPAAKKTTRRATPGKSAANTKTGAKKSATPESDDPYQIARRVWPD